MSKRTKPNRAFRCFSDKENFEGIEWRAENSDMVIWWICAGTGNQKQPVATVHDGRIVVTWRDDIVWSMPTRAEGGASMKVQLAKG